MNDEFDSLFDNSKLGFILKKAKTLTKEECRHVYNYFKINRPKVMLEFGVQHACSTAVFLEMSKWLDLNLELHSFDISDRIRFADKKAFNFHLEDVTDREEETILKYNPDVIFLDAHPYYLTKGLMQACVKHKVDFLAHDVSVGLYDLLATKTNNFENKNIYGAWELYILTELFGESLLKSDEFENHVVKINCCRDKFGLAIVEVK